MLKEKSVADNPFASGKTEDSIFWTIYQEAMDPILLVGFDNCVLDCNAALLHQLGFKDKSQLIGRSIGDFSPPCQPDGSPSVEKAATYAAKLLQHGHIRFEWVHNRDDGSLFEVETTAMVVTWQGQQISYSQLRDISEQKQLLKKLHESEETARRIFEDAADPVMIFRQDVLTDFNRAAVKQLGYATREELLGLAPLDVSAPLQADGRSTQEILPEITVAAMQGKSGFEWRLRRCDGTEFDAEFTLTSITVNGENVLHIRWHDLSEQKRLLQKLRENEDASRRIFDEAADPVVMFTHGVISDCNKAALQQMGYQHKRDLLGKTPVDLAASVQADGRPSAELAEELISEAVRSGKKSFEWLLQRKDGSIFEVEFTLTAITVNGEDVLHIRWREIGEQKRLTRELRESEESFRRIFEEAGNPVLLFKDGHLVDSNAAAIEFLAYPDKLALVGKTPLDIAPAYQANGQSSAEMVREMALLTLRHGHQHFEWEMQRMDGTLVETEATLTSITVRGELLIHAQLRDLTEQNRLQAALYAEKERAVVTLASIGDAVITTNAKGDVTFINHVASKLTGWDAGEATGQPAAEIFHIVNENTRAQVLSPIDEVLQHGKTVNLANHTVLIARDGKEYNIEDSAAPIYLPNGALLGCVLVFHDVTEKHQLLKNVRWQAGHDVLTGLPNRVLLADRFERALAVARRQKNLLGVCLMDLDQFKPVNDLYGHSIGDKLLIEVTQRMNVAVRSEDTLARLGGDEFVLLLGNLADIPQLEMVLQRILDAVSAPYSIDSYAINISASIGVAIYPMDDADVDTLLRHADQAMYLAKQAGRNRFHWFDVVYDQQAQTVQQTLANVREALLGNELCLHYQPKVNMRSGEIIGMEALLRWQHPQQGLLPPLDFLPAVEQTDLIIEIGEWVIEQALQQSRAWSAAGKNWPISVNIAARHFHLADFFDRLKAILARHPDVPPQRLEIEILESVAIGDMAHVQRLILTCQALGVRFSLDDFGTGYSSLSYLKRLPADTLKIDQSFVRDMLDDADDLALIEAIIGLAGTFNRIAVAEGVETAEHGVLLMRLGCDIGQGYGIARPMPAAHVTDWAAHFTPHAKWALWANQWDMRDLPLLMAQHDYRNLIKQILLALEDPSMPFPHEQLAGGSSRRRFGHWYCGEGKTRYGRLAEFDAIGPLYFRAHQFGTEIMRLHGEGKIDEARAQCSALMTFKDQVIASLDALELARQRHGLSSGM